MTVIYLYQGGFRAVRDRMSGAFRFAHEAGWELRPLEISELRGDLAREYAYWGASGLLIEGGLVRRPRLLASLAKISGPVVWCDVDANAVPGPLYAVRHDSRRTAETVVDKLLGRKDCRSFGFVTAGIRCEWSKEREETFVTMMQSARREHAVFDLVAASRGGSAADCFRRLGDWLAALRRPCGIFAANDETGELVLTAARQFGLSVPQDVAVIGIDNDEVVCENAVPTLASIAPDFERSGYLAAELLSRRLSDPDLPPEVVLFGSGELVPRASIRAMDYADRAALKAVEFIRLNACRDISVVKVAQTMKVGRRSAEIRFRRQTGHSIQDEIDEVRFRTACELLKSGTVPLKSLHLRCGFASARGLRNLFLKLTGRPTSQWSE